MQDFYVWWQQRSKAEVITMIIALYSLIFAAGIDIGRALYQATH